MRLTFAMLVAAFMADFDGTIGGFFELHLCIEQRVACFGRRGVLEIALGMCLLFGSITQLVDGIDLIF